MTYGEPVAEVLDVSREDDVTTTRLRLVRGSVLAEPVAPGGLCSGRRADQEVLQLHKLVGREPGDAFIFESYELEAPLPDVGSRLAFRARWIPALWQAVTERTRAWERKPYDESDDDRCLLTPPRSLGLFRRSSAGPVCGAHGLGLSPATSLRDVAELSRRDMEFATRV